MRITNSALMVMVGLGFCGHTASAADLPPRPEYKAPVMVSAPSWTGCYVGGNLGYAWGRSEINASGGSLSWTNGGLTGGGQVGCDYQFVGTNFVVGARDMFNWTGLSSNGTFLNGPLAGSIGTSNTQWFNTLTARAGWAVIPNGLLYVQGGGAWSRANQEILTGGVKVGQFANNKGGYDVGAGWEYKFAQNWSAFIEYNYQNYGTKSVTTTTGVNVDLKKDSQNVLFGVNWRL